MKETVLDVLMYLFDHYIDEGSEFMANEEMLKMELTQAGFAERQVHKAFDWLEGLVIQRESSSVPLLSERPSMRIFAEEETKKIDVACRGFLLFLEQHCVLDASDRELVIDRLMALETDEIDVQQVKWVVMMVLCNQPGKEGALAWIENLTLEEARTGLQ
jgi:Smg protein